jgi:phage FluMu gp28-like protein
MLDKSRFKAGMFSRQTGKTFTTTLEIVDDCFEAWSQKRRARWVILSRGERQAKEAMDEGVKLHAQAYGMAIEDFTESTFLCETESEKQGRDIAVKALEVKLPGGSRITALPANPDTARGYSANLFLDEFAIHARSREIWGACFPLVSKKGLKLRVTSTPKGKANKFYEIMTAKDSTWSRHTVDIYQAVADGLERNIEELRAGLADEELWRQEYGLEWLEDGDAWLGYDLIMSCEDPNAGKPELYRGGPCYIGNDIAIRRDLWVAWVWERVGDVLWCRELVTIKGGSFAQRDGVIDRLFKQYRVVGAALDQTGMGEPVVEGVKNRHGSMRVHGVQFTAAAKMEMAVLAKQAFEDRKVRIPEGNLALRHDLHKLKRVLGPTGIPRFIADSDSDGHADRAWSAFLGITVADAGESPIEFETVRQRSDWSDGDGGRSFGEHSL